MKGMIKNIGQDWKEIGGLEKENKLRDIGQ